MTPVGAVVVAQAAPDVLGASWGAILQGGAVAILLFVALYLVVIRGAIRPEREVKDRDAQIAKVEADCAKELSDTRADYEKRLSEVRADFERQLADLRAQLVKTEAGYEQRIAKYEAATAKQEAMIFDLTGAARSLAQVSAREKEPP